MGKVRINAFFVTEIIVDLTLGLELKRDQFH